MEPGYYSTQQQPQDPRADFSEQTSRPEDFPSSSPDLAATVGVVGDERFDELPDERLDALHCIPLDLPASPQPVCVNPDQTSWKVNIFLSFKTFH